MWIDETPWSGSTELHELQRLPDGTRRCQHCGAMWRAKPRGHAAHCPRVPMFLSWGDVPDSLVTRTRARKHGLAVEGHPSACVQVTVSQGNVARFPLYRVLQLGLFR